VLSGMVSRLRTSFSQQRLQFINRFSGVVIVAFGIYCLTNVLSK